MIRYEKYKSLHIGDNDRLFYHLLESLKNFSEENLFFARDEDLNLLISFDRKTVFKVKDLVYYDIEDEFAKNTVKRHDQCLDDLKTRELNE